MKPGDLVEYLHYENVPNSAHCRPVKSIATFIKDTTVLNCKLPVAKILTTDGRYIAVLKENLKELNNDK